MPIIMPKPEDDQALILNLALSVCDYWNNNGGTDNLVKLFTAPSAAKQVSEDGGEILSAFFPKEPGAFKRLATLLVVSRLTPLFFLGAPESTAENFIDVPIEREQMWLPRVCFLLIMPCFRLLSVKDQKGKAIPLTHWSGFPSNHSKAEFLLWLEWLHDYSTEPLAGEGPDENLARRGRMTLATTLILEAMYYQSGHPKHEICGVCDNALRTDNNVWASVVFDGILRQNKLDNQKKAKGG